MALEGVYWKPDGGLSAATPLTSIFLISDTLIIKLYERTKVNKYFKKDNKCKQ